MITHPPIYDLYQVIKNARTGEDGLHDFGTFDSLAAAKQEARKELKGCRWAIFERRLIAQSKEKETA